MSGFMTCPCCRETVHPAMPDDGSICDGCRYDGYERCVRCEQWTRDSESHRMGFDDLPTVCKHCVSLVAATAPCETYDYLVELTAFLANNGKDADCVAQAVEKPRKWRDEWALWSIVNDFENAKRAAAQARRHEALAKAAPVPTTP